MPLDYSSEDATTSSRNGIPNGALTVLIIAAIAIVSVVVTLFCMLVNNRRNARLRQRTNQQRVPSSILSRITAGSNISSPVETPRPANFPPMYICSSTIDPKFDAPPSYEEAVRAMVGQQHAATITPLATPGTMQDGIEQTNDIGTNESEAAQIDVEMVHAVPSTSRRSPPIDSQV
ncbi:unnamed protein product [Caenorhabditis bovis]|uniref:Uncharacterized protein n=1 Tax=Caenorhabditis bovis TaxID=2654633 RepID=A0A8S1ESX2_9PELO|nr:unnamed protein product [Caenorhabditis bovis]